MPDRVLVVDVVDDLAAAVQHVVAGQDIAGDDGALLAPILLHVVEGADQRHGADRIDGADLDIGGGRRRRRRAGGVERRERQRDLPDAVGERDLHLPRAHRQRVLGRSGARDADDDAVQIADVVRHQLHPDAWPEHLGKAVPTIENIVELGPLVLYRLIALEIVEHVATVSGKLLSRLAESIIGFLPADRLQSFKVTLGALLCRRDVGGEFGGDGLQHFER